MALPKRQNAFYQAQAILSRRDHSVAELSGKLKRRGFSGAEITGVVKTLQAQGFLDDAASARRYAEYSLQTKAVGPRWLKQKLRQRGFSAALINEAVSAAFFIQPEEALARRAAQGWQRLHQTKKTGDEARLFRFLIGRGFSVATAQAESSRLIRS